MPGLYAKGDFDLAGFTVGAVERRHVLPRTSTMKEGDVVIGVASSGLHSNGFSLVRRVVADAGGAYDKPAPFDAARTLADALLAPTRLYVKSSLEAIRAGGVKGLAHITGGGITENLPRILPDGLNAEIDTRAWDEPPIFRVIRQRGSIATDEMFRAFNMGIGLIVACAARDA